MAIVTSGVGIFDFSDVCLTQIFEGSGVVWTRRMFGNFPPDFFCRAHIRDRHTSSSNANSWFFCGWSHKAAAADTLQFAANISTGEKADIAPLQSTVRMRGKGGYHSNERDKN